jgi:N-carbamoylputrescine amidase
MSAFAETSMNQGGDTLRIALLQHACGPDVQENFARAESLLRDAARQGAQLAVTQELFTTLYFPQREEDAAFALAEPIPGPTTQRLSALAAELKLSVSASIFEKRAAGLYHNTTVMIGPDGSLRGRYRKMHIPDDPGFYEKYYFTPGDAGDAASGNDAGWRTFDVASARVGTLICWDQWFPEAARLTTLHGAQVLLYPTAIGWIPSEPRDVQLQQREAWRTVQIAHAITNGVFVAACNRVGVEGDTTFWGGSFVADPTGRVIAQADDTQPQVLMADIDLSVIDAQRHAWPFLRDRRIDAYAQLLRRHLEP